MKTLPWGIRPPFLVAYENPSLWHHHTQVNAKGWTNVRVVEADACTFKPDEPTVTLVTFSYSLSSMNVGLCVLV